MLFISRIADRVAVPPSISIAPPNNEAKLSEMSTEPNVSVPSLTSAPPEPVADPLTRFMFNSRKVD